MQLPLNRSWGEVVGEFFCNKVGNVVLPFWANTVLNLSGLFIKNRCLIKDSGSKFVVLVG